MRLTILDSLVKFSMELLLVDQELAESKLYRANRAFSRLNGRDVADLLYIHTLMVYMLCQDTEQGNYGIEYAEETSRFGGYSVFKTNSTDLYMLAYTVSNPETGYIRLDDAYASKKFLLNLHFDKRAHQRFMHDLSRDNVSNSQASSYLYRLESQLKIKDSRYKSWRRRVVDWQSESVSSRKSTAAAFKKELKRIANYGELIVPVSAIAEFEVSRDKYVPLDTPTTSSKIAGAAIGAVVGRYVASKIADKTGGDKAKMKNIGTGLGAIAGYWNAGRQRKQS